MEFPTFCREKWPPTLKMIAADKRISMNRKENGKEEVTDAGRKDSRIFVKFSLHALAIGDCGIVFRSLRATRKLKLHYRT